MVLGSPAVNTADRFVFWSEIAEAGDSEFQTVNCYDKAIDTSSEVVARQSMYVTLFEDMLKTVMSSEAYLFSHEEIGCLRNYDNLTYKGRYLLIRLCLRKTDKWHRLDSLKYQGELGDDILDAVHELCSDSDASSLKPYDHVKVEEKEIIDFTFDERSQQPVPGPSNSQEPNCESAIRTEPDYSVFAEDDSHASLCELLECLLMDELKTIAKQMKLKLATKRDVLVDTILSSSSTQSTLGFPVISSYSAVGKGKARADSKPLKQTHLPFTVHSCGKGRVKTQMDRLRDMVMKILGKCIRINEDVVKLIRRINLVYFRSTQHASSLLIPSILSRTSKRTYASYTYTRTADIWLSRSALLAYEEAIVLEAQVDALLDASGSGSTSSRERSAASKTPGLSTRSSKTPGSAKKKKPHSENELHHDRKDGALQEQLEHENPRVQNARTVRGILEQVYPRWQELVKTEGEKTGRTRGLERFDCGHVLTRVVCKGSYALGVLKEYQYELEVLEALLAQRRWRRGRRGRWYDRRALILMTHFPQDEETSLRAMEAVIEALNDDDTHIVWRPMLERRLTRLESRLKMPMEERHTCLGKLQKADKILIEGVRVYHREASLVLDQTGRIVNKRLVTPAKGRESCAGAIPAKSPILIWTKGPEPMPAKPQIEVKHKATGKSIWKGRDDEEVSVEMLSLQYYEDHGYRGFHCEGRIVTTLFGLLFWDIIFAPVPGAFETPFQAAPLDIAEDTFYFSRKDLADRRFEELCAGQAAEIVARVYDEHVEKGTWCVGVRWDLFGKEDLLGIARCLGGDALVAICRLLCEDYAGRVDGVPDLVIWNPEEEQCKFVEVKGPGDTLQENQKVWIDVLLQAGTHVEVCHVVEQGTQKAAKGKKAKAQGKSAGMSKGTGRKRKRTEVKEEGEAAPVESEDEPEDEVDFSQRDRTASDEGDILPVALEAAPSRAAKRAANHAEVVITSSPKDLQSPAKRRRVEALPQSSP
ncbi:hypothetical protein AcW1_006029 [Taiwanofungus camphoratus]|nr:hypothetical protein AcW1_006029 [Antrodia cinnamomea]